MTRENGFIISKKGSARKKDNSRLYIIRWSKPGTKAQWEIRFREAPDTDVSFARGDPITLETSSDKVTVYNDKLHTSVTGTIE